ncbi:hypothetical protein NMJ18_004488, partial [Escherichia coli]|nr:hypothetical protein [Escherichia coli]
ALRKPRPAFTAHAVCPDFFLQPVQQPHQFSRKYHAVPVLAPFLLQLLRQAAALRFLPLAVVCFDADERREAPRLISEGAFQPGPKTPTGAGVFVR